MTASSSTSRRSGASFRSTSRGRRSSRPLGRALRGKYDWAHLAMHLWPERVVPKCATDRSLAIAHGLEDVFWVEGADGKWAARKTPTRSIEELVARADVAGGEGGLEEPARGARRCRQRRPREQRPPPTASPTEETPDASAARLHRQQVARASSRSRRVVVWYDERSEFAPFVDELRGGPRGGHEPVEVAMGGSSAHLAEYAGSMFEVRAVVEPLVCGDTRRHGRHVPPGCARDRTARC